SIDPLIYNSDSVNVYPVIQFSYNGIASDGVPTTLQAQLTWNNGTAQSWVTFDTSSLVAGQPFEGALQVNSQVTQTGVYPYKVEVKATYASGTIDLIQTGIDPMVVTDGTGASADPYGPGWSYSEVDSLMPISATTGVPAGVLYIYGTGGSR